MPWRRIGKALLFPPTAIRVILLPVAAGGLVYTMLRLGEMNPIRLSAYVLAFYTLVVACAQIPNIVRSVGRIKKENKYIRIWTDDPRLRMNVTVSGSVLWNGVYGALQLGLGIYHRSAWFYSLAAYYVTLAIMRLSLVWYTMRHKPGEQITTIAMATYTFAMLTVAIVNVVRYRKYNSPVLSSAKAISLAAACVSMLTLESTMLASFNKGTLSQKTIRIFLALSGGAVSAFIVGMAVYMIVQASRKLKSLEVSHGK